MPSSIPTTQHVFRSLLRTVRKVAPGLRCELVAGKASEFPNERDFAMCGIVEPGRAQIIVAPKIEREPIDVIAALVRHELGHAILLHTYGDEHAERDADMIAEVVFGDPIYYDHRDVETLAGGRRPRPGYLPR